LFFIDYYNCVLNVYDKNNQSLSRLEIPNENSLLDSIWSKNQFVESDRTDIRIRLHRFNSVFAFDNGLYLLEMCGEKKILNNWIINLERRSALITPISSLFGDFTQKIQKDIFFDSIPGSFDRGIIGVIYNTEKFNLHKAKYPILNDIQFNAVDNPILVFFEFNKHEE